MKCLVSALILCTTLCLISAEQSTTPDYRDKYDHLWLEWVNERIREGERFLERLSVELKELKTKPNEDNRKRIELEVETTIDSIKMTLTRFETELKNPDLDLLEKYTLQKIKTDGELVIKLLVEVQKAIAKKP